MRYLSAYVDAVRRIDGIKILGKALPAPGDAIVQRSARDILDALHQRHQVVFGARSHRRKAHPAVAHDHGGYAMPGAGRYLLVPAHLTVVVSVNVHEARRQQQTFGIHCAHRTAELAGRIDRDDATIRHRHVRLERRLIGAVHHARVSDQQIVHGSPPVLVAAERGS